MSARPVTTVTKADVERLTPRELEIARLLVRGLTTREVGGRLGLDPQTIQRDIDMIRARLRVERRVDIIVAMVALGFAGEEGNSV